jgi:hypothetical protein
MGSHFLLGGGCEQSPVREGASSNSRSSRNEPAGPEYGQQQHQGICSVPAFGNGLAAAALPGLQLVDDT